MNCKLPIDISTSCIFISCRLNCGTAFHLCKEDEHRQLCPKETVSCINSDYGCPMTMTRQKIGQHLEVCPASVVTCTLDWNRWPVNETDTQFYSNALQDPSWENQLDLAIALRDQKLLFSSIRMKTLFPELIERPESPEDVLGGAVGGPDAQCWDSHDLNKDDLFDNSVNVEEMPELTQEERLALAQSKEVACLESYGVWEKMFTKDKEGCKQTVKNLERNSSPNYEKDTKSTAQDSSKTDLCRTGLAPWQDGILDRLSKEVNVAEYNMYLVHNGCMLINFGQLAACTPKEKDFVYGNLEPIEVQTLHSFNVPSSYRAKRSHLKDPSQKIKKTHQTVDTSDLGVAVESLPKANVVDATLLCSLEKELKGHQISETVGTDGLYVDVGTQTYDFHSAPFKIDATLADVAGMPQSLHVQIQTECVTRRHNKSSSAFTYLCCHAFRRDEYPWHFKNVHGDIQSSLSGWFLQRCPLAYLGCSFSRKQFQPAKYQATVSYDSDLSAFILQPEVDMSLYKGVRTINSERKRAKNMDSLSSLPFEVLQHIICFLDSVSLARLSQVSQLMREVCSTVLQQKGMVSLKWEKKTYSHGGFTWRSRKKVWEFSTLFSPVDKWVFEDIPSMAEHLKVCPFYQTEVRSEPVALPSMTDLQGENKDFQSLLISIFATEKEDGQ
ncbi:hypothetical protein DNTS_023753 [Danionella cerebrum]|uniref:F-box domain-containing protein n=1 Tax=Danionella cerebrum TaxID=2873325 RepID=A0A553QV26_9TELE|nr:hypothetical protein DNTS_023753 [Danionella translucida]